jgi:mannose-1-phosphate guanylyltransferase
MFQHTLDRADAVTERENKIVLVAGDHQAVALDQMACRRYRKVVLQPSNRDTPAAIFLALSYVRAFDAEATVVVFPSDHFIYPERRFVGVATSALRAASCLKEWLVLLGVPADYPESE